MAIKRAGCILGISFIMLVVGCASGISQQSRSKVTYTETFSALQKTPDVYKGEVIMFGGRIIETKASPARTHRPATRPWLQWSAS